MQLLFLCISEDFDLAKSIPPLDAVGIVYHITSFVSKQLKILFEYLHNTQHVV